MFKRIYLHIPFCRRKCLYCAFVSREPRAGDLDAYVRALQEEMQLAASADPPSGPVRSLYFGGGTPSLLKPQQIELLLRQADKLFGLAADAEITMEINPGTVDETSLTAFRSAGVNRLSIGLQSFNDEMLVRLGRIHSAEQARDAFMAARSAGFDNIGIDLIHSLPGQSEVMWQHELEQALALKPEHISVYGLTIEEETPFAARYSDENLLPDEEASAAMFETAHNLLTAAGYEHYEIANYARPGRRSQHNSGYWRRDGYLGLGAGAHSFLRNREYGIRFGNSADIDGYMDAVRSGKLSRIELTELTRDDAMAEFIFLGLRMSDGVSKQLLEREFGEKLQDLFGSELELLCRQGLLTASDDRFSLTLRGMLLSNRVFSEFIR